MADLTVTAASVQPTSTTKRLTKIAAEAITAGESVYVNTNDQLALADNDLSAAAASAVGIALASAAAGQPCPYAYEGDLDMGSILTAGLIYVVSSTPGGIAPSADLASGDYTTILGVAKDADTLSLHVHASGNQV